MSEQQDALAIIGPAKSGKSTVGPIVASRLGVPFHVHDIISMGREHEGYDSAYADQLSSKEGVTAWYRYLLPLAVEKLETALANPEPSVVEIARWYADAADANLFGRVQAVLSKFKHVAMLTPAADSGRAFKILQDRWMVPLNGIDLNLYFLRHPSNRRLAKQVVYTQGRTSLQTRDDILTRIDPSCGTVVLIGPMRAGKSTQAVLLSEALGKKRVPLDDVRWEYYKECGWSAEAEGEYWKTEGVSGVIRYWKQFEIHAVERVRADHPDCVIDFGAGHSVYDDEAMFARAQKALEPIANTVLLVPTEDADESFEILRDRDSIKSGGVDGNLYFLRAPEVRALATHVVVTEGKTQEQTGDDILAAMESRR